MKGSMKSKHFETSVVVAVKPVSPESPLAYVHALLGRKLDISLEDGRTIEGRLVAVDWAGNVYLTGVDLTAGDSIFQLQKVIVPFARIREMSTLKPIQVTPAAGAKK
jgi:small nuclear ribonucleoprotein (snRNP)-like protein